ncbi:hypothetical protein NM688_g5549 [Phlebia brevispora]|uniref:Uncharacterized protein n=1 Tax=Phlebia brevispora TaxID=194682 RepID=A0ACC1STJ8_9APHY|nr:hypothetical protein NM688_g5549 [Phlebia brevispora]
MSSEAKTDTKATTTAKTTSVEEALEHAKRAFALKKYEQAVDHYATALELMTAKVGDDAPEMADLYFAYGKALLENAISQSGVLGKEQPEDALHDEDEASKSGAFLSFSGDVEDEEDEPVDLFAEAAKEVEDGGEEDDGEPEDDFNAAWEVLDLARTLYDKRKDEDDETMLKLADTYITLGDVSLETEKFDQAIHDYTMGLDLKIDLLPQSSRQIAEAHYKLSMVLDLTSGRQTDSIYHAEKALASIEARLAELRDAMGDQMKVESAPQPVDVKGKGKDTAKGPRLPGDDSIHKLSKSQMEAEVKELDGLKEDLALKVDELKSLQSDTRESAPVLAAKALDKELSAGSASAALPTEVHDLTSIVKKKKKSAAGVNGADASAPKRKAEDDVPEALSEKKAKLDSEAPQP